jgi:hypothetical protein
MNDNFIAKELEDTLKIIIKHALFGDEKTLGSILFSIKDVAVKDYMLLNLTKFTNNLVDLISKIKNNTRGYGLLIKDIDEIEDPVNNVKILDNMIYIKGNHLLEFSDNMMIRDLNYNMDLNIYDSLIEVFMNFFYNKKYTEYLKANNQIYARVNYDQTANIINKMIYYSNNNLKCGK